MNTPTFLPDIVKKSFLKVTPAGCYHAVESGEPTIVRMLLQQILSTAVTPTFSDFTNSEQQSILTLAESGFLGFDSTHTTLPGGNLSELLPQVLPALSERQRVVLSEARQGLFIDYVGVSRDQAEEIAALAASLRSLSEGHVGLLTEQLSTPSLAFGVIDPAGNSDIGFWPLHIADKVFTLTILGIPRLNAVEFRLLVWALIERYGADNQR